MRRDLEALLFASDQPLTLAKIASFFPDVDRKALKSALEELKDEYDRDQHAFTIVEFGGGYSISTRPEHAKLVRKLFRGRRKVRLSKPALECLAIIAYKQPVTRLEIEEIRGVSVQGVIGTLLERDLVHIVGRAQSLGSPLLYGTTKAFLDYMGLNHLRELPQLSELEDILTEKEELKQLAMKRDADLSDEDFDRALAPEEDAALEEGEEIVEEASAEQADDEDFDDFDEDEPKAMEANADSDSDHAAASESLPG